MDTPIPTETVTELKVGDRVQVADEGREDDYGIVVETARQIWTNVPTSYLTVEVPRVGNATVYIPEADVRRIPPGEEQEISLRPWVVTGESICDDPDEYNHPHQLFVHEGSLPEIIRVYLAANGLSAPGSTKAAPKDDETAEAIAVELETLAQELQQLANQRAEIDGDDFEECDDADQADCHTAASIATYVRAKSLLLRRAASLRGEQ